MRNRLLKSFAPLLAAGALACGGCATVEMSAPNSLAGIDVKGAEGKADRFIMISNEGYFFFWTVPVVAGDMSTWNDHQRKLESTISFFSAETRVQKLTDILYHYADSMNCDAVDLVIDDNTNCAPGFFGIVDIFRTVFGCQSVVVSAVLKKR